MITLWRGFRAMPSRPSTTASGWRDTRRPLSSGGGASPRVGRQAMARRRAAKYDEPLCAEFAAQDRCGPRAAFEPARRVVSFRGSVPWQR